MKGIRFTPAMAVTALRTLNPKLETRRLIRPQPPEGYDSRCEANDGNVCWENSVQQVWPDAWEGLPCDYKVGERRCLLTTWAVPKCLDDRKPTEIKNLGGGFWHAGQCAKPQWAGKSRPGMFLPNHLRHLMPVLKVTSVRAERLSAITAEGAKREGLSVYSKDGQLDKYGIADYDGQPGTDDLGWPWAKWEADPAAAYRTLWEKINGAGSWEKNPWCWVIGFRRAP